MRQGPRRPPSPRRGLTLSPHPPTTPTERRSRWHFVALAYGSLREKAIEIVSPGDRKPGKLECYADHRVEELLIVDPQEKTSSWLGLEAGEYKHSKRSRLIDLGAAGLAERID